MGLEAITLWLRVHRRRVPLAAACSIYLARVQLRHRLRSPTARQLGQNRAHARGEGVGLALAALAARRPAAEPLAALPGDRQPLLVLLLIRARSFCASAANRCSTNGSTSAPSSVTMNGTR